ncbi:probable 3-hydroxyisobutyryl-CoA hydrolase 3 isoform X2 [Zingiber officinale]|uniref:probable 3-hydroxyisobutyryl-CoA hydrolase 3 isoform X2 n=1 Tax=Zingiber officinale TaxID=94328 RepID=UPI001C4AB0F5|nr:probable 3-hydroxyisobutyryl-CoA hydrolase 3 isoform X2 [Zingiber officinale]
MAPNRPSNYEDDQVLQLSEEFQKLENDPAVGLVIVKANGKVFCVGGDVIECYRYSLTGIIQNGYINYLEAYVILYYSFLSEI